MEKEHKNFTFVVFAVVVSVVMVLGLSYFFYSIANSFFEIEGKYKDFTIKAGGSLALSVFLLYFVFDKIEVFYKMLFAGETVKEKTKEAPKLVKNEPEVELKRNQNMPNETPKGNLPDKEQLFKLLDNPNTIREALDLADTIPFEGSDRLLFNMKRSDFELLETNKEKMRLSEQVKSIISRYLK